MDEAGSFGVLILVESFVEVVEVVVEVVEVDGVEMVRDEMAEDGGSSGVDEITGEGTGEVVGWWGW